MYRKGCFFSENNKKPKKKDIHTTKSHPIPTHPTTPHTYTHKITDAADKMKIHYEIGTMLSTNDEIMCTCVQVPSMQNSCKIYLCGYNKMHEKEIYKSNLHFFEVNWEFISSVIVILYSVSLMFLIKVNKLTKFGSLFWSLETKM